METNKQEPSKQRQMIGCIVFVLIIIFLLGKCTEDKVPPSTEEQQIEYYNRSLERAVQDLEDKMVNIPYRKYLRSGDWTDSQKLNKLKSLQNDFEAEMERKGW